MKAVPHMKHRCACKPDKRSAIRQTRTKWRGERFAGLMNVTSSGGITKLLRQRRFVINIG
ncbi:hypothetical protein E2360_20975 [Salmonella enterica subsp. enterica serovar Wien]|nr:hypothetical protein [Salmonella enterica]EBG2361342.1 hypothetical protein [Salmonella enterica subsp. enterica serovar Wien]EBV0147579.1 hypothetical protein [Salmonella enterica subsp. enterica serovar Bochum]EBW4307943.1 hypothetical protein [Salmonella enterica subsp. enterica serovar Duisburg]ECB1045315.1 hypothetical protein [Salmonella enterica subsp. enterica serovar Aschersleben]ECK8874801.1 hypothetical protein [Salmonella enterica subsp. enterica]EDT1455801.1 hypothetical prote